MAVREGEIYETGVDGYASDGSGVARIDSLAVFVREVVRGERVRVRIEHVGRSAAWGRLEEVLSPSPHRVLPDCPYYHLCGGCQLRHMDYGEELAAKAARVEEALARVGGVKVKLAAIHGAADTCRYRNKVQFPIAPGAIGYFQNRTHRVVDIADCLLQPEADTACRAAVKGWMAAFGVPAYDESTGGGLLRHLYLRTNQAGQVLCCLVANGRELPHGAELIAALRSAVPGLVGVVLNVNTRRTNVILGPEYHALWGQDFLEETLCGHTFRLSVPSFFQINRAQTEVLYRRAAEFAGLTGRETVVELYCGIGTISLTLARQARQVIGVEIVPQAVTDARANALRNGLAEKTRFACGDASALAARLELPAEEVERMRSYIEQKSYAALNDMLEAVEGNPARAALARLPYLFGGAEVLQEARGLAGPCKSLDYLAQLYEELEAAGYREIVLTGQVGTFSRSENRLMTGDELYGIGSVSKIYTTVAVMQLAEDGKVSLDAPVTRYLPDFKMADERYKDITVRMLLNHSSGILGTGLSDAMLFGAANESAYYASFTVKCFRVYLCLMPLATLNKGTFIYLQALGKAFASTAVSMTREIIFGVSLPIILPIFFGLDGLLWSFPAADLLTFIIAVFFIRQTYRELSESHSAV